MSGQKGYKNAQIDPVSKIKTTFFPLCIHAYKMVISSHGYKMTPIFKCLCKTLHFPKLLTRDQFCPASLAQSPGKYKVTWAASIKRTPHGGYCSYFCPD